MMPPEHFSCRCALVPSTWRTRIAEARRVASRSTREAEFDRRSAHCPEVLRRFIDKAKAAFVEGYQQGLRGYQFHGRYYRWVGGQNNEPY